MQVRCSIFLALLALIIFDPSFSAHSQGTEPSVMFSEAYARYYTVKDGLESNEIYDLETDTNGLMWICTSGGLTSFDGVNFVNHSPVNASQTVLGVERGSDGTMWFWTVRNEFLRWNNGLEKVYSIGPEELVSSGVVSEAQFFEDRFYFTNNNTLYEVELNADDTAKLVDKRTSKWEVLTLAEINGKMVSYGGNTHRGIKQIDYYVDDSLVKSIPAEISFYLASARRVRKAGDHLYFQIEGYIGSLSLKTWELKIVGPFFFRSPSLEILGDHFWIGLVDHGFLKIPLDDITQYERIRLKSSPSGVSDSQNENLWFSSLDKGLGVHLPGVQVFENIEALGKIETVKQVGDGVVLYGTGNSISLLHESDSGFTLNSWDVLFAGEDKRLRYIEADSQYIYMLWNDSVVQINSSYPFERSSMDESKFVFRRIMASLGRLIRYDPNTREVKVIRQNYTGTRIRHEFEYPDYGIYFGSFNASHYYDFKTDSVFNLMPDSTLDIRSSIHWKGDTFLLGTKGSGLLKAVGPRVVGKLEFPGVDTRTVQFLDEMNGRKWLSTLSQVYEIHNEGGKEHLVSWNSSLGLNRVEVAWMATWKGRLLILADQRIYLIDPDQAGSPAQETQIFGVDVFHNEELISEEDGRYFIDERSSSVMIRPRFTNLSLSNKLKIRYRIGGREANWQEVNDVVFSVPSLPSGLQSLEYQISNGFGHWPEGVQTLNFEVDPPFYKKGWFIALAILSALLIAYLIFKQRIRNAEERNRIEKQLLESSLTSLSIQLNPHFVFNSLNSVIGTIAKGDTRGAISYLSEFAGLMRTVFNSAQESWVPLEEEVESLRRYLNLEQIRFDGSFDFSIELEPRQMASQYLVPPMLFQPFAENAIVHGISTLQDEKGFILIRISEIDGNRIQVLIEDNGRGEAFHTKASRKGFGKSVSLIARRIELLNEMFGNTFDLTFEETERGGKRVSLILPRKTDENYAESNYNR